MNTRVEVETTTAAAAVIGSTRAAEAAIVVIGHALVSVVVVDTVKVAGRETCTEIDVPDLETDMNDEVGEVEVVIQGTIETHEAAHRDTDTVKKYLGERSHPSTGTSRRQALRTSSHRSTSRCKQVGKYLQHY